MKKSLTLGATIALLLVIVEACIPVSREVLPLANSNIAQIGVVFGLSYVGATLLELAKNDV